MPRDPRSARLACGCRVTFKTGVEGSPVVVVVADKAAGCALPIHVAGLAVHDHREALRPSTRFAPLSHPDYEEG